MTLQQLKYVVTVAEQGSISGAAKELFISQPSLTNAIKELEKEMQITIFHKQGDHRIRRRGCVFGIRETGLGAGGSFKGKILKCKEAESAFFGILSALFVCGQRVCGRDRGV